MTTYRVERSRERLSALFAIINNSALAARDVNVKLTRKIGGIKRRVENSAPRAVRNTYTFVAARSGFSLYPSTPRSALNSIKLRAPPEFPRARDYVSAETQFPRLKPEREKEREIKKREKGSLPLPELARRRRGGTANGRMDYAAWRRLLRYVLEHARATDSARITSDTTTY